MINLNNNNINNIEDRAFNNLPYLTTLELDGQTPELIIDQCLFSRILNNVPFIKIDQITNNAGDDGWDE